MDDPTLLALCVFEEANLEPDDGKAAVVRVVLNRIKALYESDGTIAGTILRYDQFSWAWFDFRGGRYRRVAWNQTEAAGIAAQKLEAVPASFLAHCGAIAQAVQAGTYSGPLYDQMTDDCLNYVNLAISQPSWATPDKLICKIGNHSFFRP